MRPRSRPDATRQAPSAKRIKIVMMREVARDELGKSFVTALLGANPAHQLLFNK